jgi:hypothetical protein
MKTIPLKLFSEHHWAFKYWLESGLRNATLLHFDTHADMSGIIGKVPVNELRKEKDTNKRMQITNEFCDTTLDVASFIGPAVLMGLIKEIYWVLPEWARPGTDHAGFYWDPDNSTARKPMGYQERIKLELIKNREEKLGLFLGMEETAQRVLYGQEKEFTFYAAQTEEYLHFLPLPLAKAKGQVAVKVHKIYADELPKVKKNVVLDIDLDYFSCTGFDTFSAPLPAFSIDEIKRSVTKLAQQLSQANIKPELITVATSPNYTPLEHIFVLPDLVQAELARINLPTAVTRENISYNLLEVTLAMNVRAYLEAIRSGASTGQEEIEQYFVPLSCYAQDDFEEFFKAPFAKVAVNQITPIAYLEQAGKYGLTELKDSLQGFIAAASLQEIDQDELREKSMILSTAADKIITRPTQFDARLFLLIGQYKQLQEIKKYNKQGYDKLLGILEKCKAELGLK